MSRNILVAARPEHRAVHRHSEPLVRVHADRVGALPAAEVVAELGADRRRSCVGSVDVEPRTGSPRSASAISATGSTDAMPVVPIVATTAHASSGSSRSVASGTRRPSGPSEARARAAALPSRPTSAHAPSTTTTRRPGADAQRAAMTAVDSVDAVSSMWPREPGRKAEQLSEPVDRQLLELLQRRRRAPQDSDLVEPRDEESRRGRRARSPSSRSRRRSEGSASA